MALTGLQIQKLLPQTNCKECGSNTCLAFAMKLAAKKTEISECPYASDETIKTLGEAYEPPVKAIQLGNNKQVKLGEETVLYRHEKTFVNKTAIAININDNDSTENIDKTIKTINEYSYERVGEIITIDMISVTQTGTDSENFISFIEKVNEETTKPLIVKSDDSSILIKAAEKLNGSKSVIYASTPELAESVLETIKENGHALAIAGPDLDSIIELSSKIKDSGFNDLILQFGSLSLAEQFQVNSIARHAAIKENFKPLSYPTIKFIDSGNVLEDTVSAVTEINKYGGIIVLPSFDSAQLSSLMTLRLNIYTDPQNPIQVEPKLYEIGEPKEDSPVFVTTNFSLTYFVVSGEIENSGTSAWLLVPECEGMSVLTAWAAGKFSASSIAKFINELNVEEKLTKHDIVIPGYVSQISGELEENLPNWNVIIGPQEAADLESFIKTKFS